METVKMGTASVAVKSKTHVVLCSLQRSLSELASHQKKIFDIDSHCGVAISGMTADARLLIRWMRNETVNHRFVFDAPLLTSRLVTKLVDSTYTPSFCLMYSLLVVAIKVQPMSNEPFGRIVAHLCLSRSCSSI